MKNYLLQKERKNKTMKKHLRIGIIIAIVIPVITGVFLVLSKGGTDESQITGLQGQLTELQSQIEGMQNGQLTELQSQIDGIQKGQMTELQLQVDDLQTAYVDTQLRIVDIEAADDNLQDKVRRIYNKVVQKVMSLISDDKLSIRREAAKHGDPSAQNTMGFMYCTGQLVDQDYKEAAKWFTKAAEQEHIQAQFNLGVMYSKGQGLTQDYSEAIKWYRRAAEKKYAHAQNILGLMYSRGQGVKQNYQEAVKLYRMNGYFSD